MAWRPAPYLIEGELYNTDRGKVTGWMEFVGIDERVTLDLVGEFHRDIRGAGIHLYGGATPASSNPEADEYFRRFSTHHTGKVGDITAGLPPRDHGATPYIEWYSEQNGRVVLELKRAQIAVIGSPIPACESYPIDRRQQSRNMAEFLADMAGDLRSEREQQERPRKPPTDAGGEEQSNE